MYLPTMSTYVTGLPYGIASLLAPSTSIYQCAEYIGTVE